MKKIAIVLMIILLVACGCVEQTHDSSIDNGFLNPPDSAKPWTYWWWLDSNVSKEGITADLEAMKAQGIVGVLVFDAGVGGPEVPDGPKFMSPKWREHLKFALEEADRLGMTLSLNLCSGWDAGGPWVKPDDAPKKIVWSETIVSGGGNIDLQLPLPTGIKRNYYRDTAVLAYKVSEKEAQTISKITAGTYWSNPAELASDGDLKTFWKSSRRRPGVGDKPKFLEFLKWEFAIDVPVSSLRLIPNKECGPKDCQFQYSNDGETFHTISRFVAPEVQQKSVAFKETKAKYFRLVFDTCYPYQGRENWNVQVSEVMLYQKGRKEPATLKATLKPSDSVDLTSKMDKSGKLRWDAPKGTWKVFRMGCTLVTEGRVHCASPGARGLETDPLSSKAMDRHFNATVGSCIPEMEELIGKTLKYTHIDSWELGVPTWTEGIREEFKRRRGYDPLFYLPSLAGFGKTIDNKELTGRFLHDYRRTVADCIAENYYGRLKELSGKHGMGTHPEAGGPFYFQWIDALECLGISDIPMGEYWARKDESVKTINYSDRQKLCDPIKQAASAAHVYGKKIAQAEAFTTIGPNWEKDPYMLKDIGDMAFSSGLNRNVLCYYIHQPYTDIKPGYQWGFSGTHFDRNITWFDLSHAWLTYLSRCQFMLQQGLFVADVCYYYGEDIPNFVPGRYSMDPALPEGYDCDTINTEVLLTRVSVKDGRIVLPDGMSYRILVLPKKQAMSAVVLKKVAELVKAGATVVGAKPARTPGLLGYPECDRGIKNLASKLELVSSDNLQEVLTDLGVGPDFKNSVESLHYIHRKSENADIYYISNQADEPVKTKCGFRVEGKQPEIWDAVTGEMRNATAFEVVDGHTVLPLKFAERGSLFVVFRKPINSTKGTVAPNFPEQTQIAELTGPWTVKFDPKWGGPESVVFDELVDWTKRPEPGIKFYSGKATYYKTFDMPKTAQGLKNRLRLDLKRVRNLAHVRLNGKDLGVVWTAPWQVDITQAIKPTGNKLEIDVVNLWPNRLIGDDALPPEKRVTKTNVKKFKKGMTPLPSGLLGPVELLSE